MALSINWWRGVLKAFPRHLLKIVKYEMSREDIKMDNQRYGMLFDTSSNTHYYYDAGTGKVISCTKKEKKFIEQILDGRIDVEKAKEIDREFRVFVEEENLFSNHEWVFSVPTKSEFIDLVRGHCQQIVLELTEACNLRCEYCIYNEHHPDYRGYSDKQMSFEIAQKSIDLILKNFEGEEFALTFYGGEPLANFPLLKKCIEYTRSSYPEIKLSYSFTTNLTLLTSDMLEYFKTLEDIDILCSLDGPKSIHDKYRKDIKGDGSFEMAIKNFKLLQEEFYDVSKKRNLMINCVMVPPYTKKKLNELYHFFYETLQIPKEITCNYSYVDLGNMKIFENEKDLEDSKLRISPLEEVAADDFLREGDDSDFFGLINQELYRVANRLIAKDGVIESGFLHGNCIPGQRRIYVTVDGKFRTCEKVGNVPSLGDCFSGYDYEKSYKIYIEDYIKYYQGKCNNCWARNMCGICYDNALSDNRDKLYKSGELCNTSKELIKDMFINYYRVFERDRDGLSKALSKLEFK